MFIYKHTKTTDNKDLLNEAPVLLTEAARAKFVILGEDRDK